MGILNFWKRGKEQSKQQPYVMTLDQQFMSLINDDGYVPLARNPDVIMAVNKIADMVSNMTIHLMENTDKGDVRIKDGLSRKIDINPCENMTRKTWLFKIVRDLLLYGDGNSIVHVEYDLKNDLIKNLRPFAMQNVTFKTSSDTYKIICNDIEYQPDEVIHFAINPDPNNPFIGTGYRVQLRDIVRNLNLATQTKKSFMSGKNMPTLIVKVDSSSAELATKEGRDTIAKKYLSTSSAGEPWIIPDALLEVEQVKPLSLNDIAINESVEIDKKTVAGLLGVPAFVLGVGEFDKDEHNNFVNDKIMSIAQTISQTLTRDLLLSSKMYFKLNPRSLYAYNITELVSAGKEMVTLAAMRRNELRDWVGMAPDPDMEDIIVLENYLPQDELANQKKLKGESSDIE